MVSDQGAISLKHGQPWLELLDNSENPWLNHHGQPWLTIVQPWVFTEAITLEILDMSLKPLVLSIDPDLKQPFKQICQLN